MLCVCVSLSHISFHSVIATELRERPNVFSVGEPSAIICFFFLSNRCIGVHRSIKQYLLFVPENVFHARKRFIVSIRVLCDKYSIHIWIITIDLHILSVCSHTELLKRKSILFSTILLWNFDFPSLFFHFLFLCYL